jgi:D-serine deaminase-like pyridoxal phosphate-dependent protein
LIANISRMRARAAELGVTLRPHQKTAKSRQVADLIGADAIAVSTLSEARYFAAAGYTDILYAVALGPTRADQVRRLQQEGVDIQVVIDSLEALEYSPEVGTWIEIDCDGRRSGLSPGSDELLELAARLGERLRGVMTHAGASYDGRTPKELAGWAERERAAVVTAADRIRGIGIEVAGVSVGSTPTAVHARHLEGVNEMRPGVFVFGDTFQAGIGTCRLEDVACSVLATVIGVRPGGYVIDAGALALSLDRSTAGADHGFGLVGDVDGKPLPGWRVERVTQEHGIVAPGPGTGRLRLGTRLRVFPNHACLTAACHDEYVVVSDRVVVDRWERCRGW